MAAIHDDLPRNAANHAPLSPLSFIARTAAVWPDRTSIVHGARRDTWRETYARCRRLASALAAQGIAHGDTVAALLPNTPAMVEMHFAVPMTGAVLNTLNTRLDATSIAFMLEHGRAKALVADTEFAPLVRDALARRASGPRLRGAGRQRRPRIRVVAAGGRVGRDLAQLHVRHDRRSQGRRLPPSRRLPQRDIERRRLGNAAPRRVPVDAADVPLQRLVLPVDARGDRRHQRLPAQGRCRVDPRRDPHAPRDPLLRRTDRALDADQRARRDEGGHHAQG